MAKNIIQKSSTTSRNFNYTKNKVSLNFSLRTDIKQELKDFLEILNHAVKEVEEEINKI